MLEEEGSDALREALCRGPECTGCVGIKYKL